MTSNSTKHSQLDAGKSSRIRHPGSGTDNRALKAFQHRTIGTKPDWVLIFLPTALSIKNLSVGVSALITFTAFVLITALLVVVAYTRQPTARFEIQLGPLALLFVSSAIVLTRPSSLYNVLTFILVGALALQLAKTVDARRIVASLVDGIGLYALINVLAYVAGLRSATESEGLRLSLVSDGVNRIIFPLEHSLNLPPVLAAAYVAASYFVIREPGWRRRTFRLICLAAAIIILIGSGTRVPAAVALVLPVSAILFASTYRWLGSAVTLFASVSALVLPTVVASVQFILNPVVSLISDRPESRRTLSSLNGRDYVWERSLTFWREDVTAPLNILFGYGQQGHYKSGASLTYYKLLSHIFTRDPEKIMSMHNSFLQQLFDGGLVGWIALTAAVLWASVRYSKRISDLRGYGLAAIMAISVLVICSMTEVLLQPSVTTFWILIIFVAAACQKKAPDTRNDDPVTKQSTGLLSR